MAGPRRITIKKTTPQKERVEFLLGEKDIHHTGIDCVDEYRRKAWHEYEKRSLPTNAEESWKRIDFSKVLLPEFLQGNIHSPLERGEAQVQISSNGNEHDMYAWNLADAIRDRADLISRAYAHVQTKSLDKFNALSMAFARHGAFAYIPSKAKLHEPIWIHQTDTFGGLSTLNHLISVEPDASVTIILDRHFDDENRQPSLGIENLQVQVGQGAHLKLIEINIGGPEKRQIQHQVASLDKNSTLEWVVFTSDAYFVKKFLHVNLMGQGAMTKIAGIYLAGAQQQLEFDTYQNHQAANTSSDLLFKGVVLGAARALFRGMIHISQNAQKSDGYQSNRNLVLSDQAHADSIPGLEILADDVRCTHGATIGKIDPEEMFYLNSRGIDYTDAMRLIVNGFFEPLVQRIENDSLRNAIKERIEANLFLEL